MLGLTCDACMGLHSYTWIKGILCLMYFITSIYIDHACTSGMYVMYVPIYIMHV